MLGFVLKSLFEKKFKEAFVMSEHEINQFS